MVGPNLGESSFDLFANEIVLYFETIQGKDMQNLANIPRALWPAVMATARAAFSVRNKFGIYAFGIGPRIRRGRPGLAHALNVYVKRKVSDPQLAVPQLTVIAGKRKWNLNPNVIATGKRPRAAMGAGVDYSGLHPGAAITIGGSTPGRGAIACILTVGDGPSHALTAGHLFPPDNIGAAVYAAADSGSTARQVGQLVANFLDDSDIDLALLKLTSAGASMVGDGGPQLSDYLPERSVWGKSTRAFLATTNDYSRQASTNGGPTDALLSAPTRGNYWVHSVVGTDGEVTNAGDSGTVLCTGNSNQYAVGTCCGSFGAHSVFEPFGRAMELVQDKIDSNLSLFTDAT